MSQSRHASPGLDALGGGLSVAAVLAVLARWLPLEFRYHPNALGIVSATTEARYPTQQETILFLAFGAAGVAGVWLVGGLLAGRARTLGQRVAIELGAFVALLAALWLPRGPGTAAVAAALVGVGFVASRPAAAGDAPSAADRPGPEIDRPGPEARPSRRGAALGLGLGIVVLALLRVPRFAQAVWALARGTSDLALARNDWVFLSEDGQHLAWADFLQAGGLHGRDFFCLYGPLYDWSVVGLWELFGRSVATWHLHVGLTEVLAWVAFLGLAAHLLERRWLLVPLALVTPHLTLRVGLGLASLLFLFRHGRGGRRADVFLAGLATGLSLLYSQEFGMAAWLASWAMLALPPAWGALALHGAGVAVALLPLLGYYAAAGALGPMLADLAGYPALLMAGFGNLPFPSLRATLPWPWVPPLGGGPAVFYAIPAILVVGLGVSLPRRVPSVRGPLPWLRQLVDDWASRPRPREVALLALFGLAAFRSALGRSDTLHLFAVAGPATLLLAVGADRLLARWRDDAARIELALAAALLWLGGIVSGPAAAGAYHLHAGVDTAVRFVRGGPEGRGSGAIARVVGWLEANAEPDDRLYFLPNEAALYYLTDRLSPTRFVVAHQMVTDAHRAEALRDLRAAPPRYVVWNDASLKLDGADDAVLLGPELWGWLQRHYAPRQRVGGMRIWEWRGPQAGPRADAEPSAAGP